MCKRGNLIVISGPSGVGKSSVIKRAIDGAEDVCFSVSATTRSPRPGEIDGREYFFVSPEEFNRMIGNGELLEYAQFAGNYYGTPCSQVLDRLDRGQTVILDIEVQGASQVKNNYPDAVSIFISPPSMEELEKRLISRGTESKEKIEQRLETAKREMLLVDSYDYQIVNDDLQKAAQALKSIIFNG